MKKTNRTRGLVSSKHILRAAVWATPLIAATSVHAATVTYWDINGTTAGAGGATPTGTWSSSTSNWTTDSTGASATVLWNNANNDTPTFSAGTDATGAFTVTVSGTQNATGLTFEEGTVTLGGAGTINLTGTNSILNQAGVASGTITPREITISGNISGTSGTTFGTIASASGVTQFTLGGSNSAWTGKINVGQGNGFNGSSNPNNYIELVPTTDTALGASGVANEIEFTTSGANINNYSRIKLTGNRIINKDVIIRGGGGTGTDGFGQIQNSGGTNTWAGDIYATSNSTGSNGSGAALTSNSGTLVVTGVIRNGTGGTANGFWEKTGDATVALENTNTFTNFVRMNQGILEVRANGALGSAGTPGDLTANTLITGNEANGSATKATVAFRAPASAPAGFNYSTFEMLDVAGQRAATTSPIVGTGVDNLGGNNTFAGDIRYGQLGAVNTGVGNMLSASAGSLKLTGHVWAAQAAIPRIITKAGNGELILAADNSTGNTPLSARPTFPLDAGTFVVAAGTLTVAENGTLNAGINIQINPMTTVKMDNSAIVVNNRLKTTTPLTLSTGNVILLGNTTSSSSQTFDSLSFNSGMSELTVSQPTSGNGSTTTMTVTNAMTHSGHSTGLVHGLEATGSLMSVGSVPVGTMLGGNGAGTLTNIVPWVVANRVDNTSSDFVTVGDGSGSGALRALTSGEYTPLANNNATRDNVTASSADNGGSNTLAANMTQVNALKMNAGSTVVIGAGKRLWVYSGAILGSSTGSRTISGGNLVFEQYQTPGTTDGQAGAYDTDPKRDGANSDNTHPVTDAPIPGTANEAVITVPANTTLIQAADNVMGGAAGLTKSGAGTLVLHGTNTLGGIRHYWMFDGNQTSNETLASTPGQTTINAGRLEFDTDVNLGAAGATVVINGGTLVPLSSSSAARPITLQSTASNIIETGGSADYTTAGLVTGLTLTKTGTGILTFTNTGNTYSGGTLINAGSMRLSDTDPQQHQFGTGSITLNGGSLRADTDVTLDHSIISTSGTSTTSGFIIAPGKTVTFGASNASAVTMTGSGNWAIDGGGTLLMAHTLATQTYTGFLIVKNGSTLEFQAGGAIDSGLGGTPKSGGAWVQLSGGSRLKFDLTSSGGTNFSGSARDISVSGSGTIEVTPTNTVINTGGITGSGTLTKDGTGLYSLRTSNTYSGKWNVLQGTLEFGAPTNNALSLGTGSGADFVTIQNGATLRMTSTATSGTMGATQGITLAGASTSIDVATGTTLSVPGDITAGTGKTLNKIGLGTLKIKNFRGDTLNISAGNVGILPNSTATGTSVVSTLTTGANKLDLTDNKLIITTPGKTGTFTGGVYTETAGLVAAGRNPTGGGVPQWNAAGIITSQTAALGTMASTIAVASASDVGKTSFGGQNVNPTDTLVMYTWNGDANMTGKVDADDYFIIDSNYNKNGTLYGFSKGDFNYDGKINGDDYAMIDAGYINQGTPISAGATLDGGLPGGVSAVPEPGSFALLSLGAMSVLGRRRRSR